MRTRNKTLLRIFCVGAVFIAACLVFLIRMINIAANAEPDKIQTGTYERREPIIAQRGEIYDRNGNKLVYNEYSYDLVFDYDAMAATQAERNEDILVIIGALQKKGVSITDQADSFPFDGTYPNYTYKKEISDPNSDLYYRLLKRIAENRVVLDLQILIFRPEIAAQNCILIFILAILSLAFPLIKIKSIIYFIVERTF